MKAALVHKETNKMQESFVIYSKANDGFHNDQRGWSSLMFATQYTLSDAMTKPANQQAEDGKWMSYSEAKKKFKE